MVFLLFSLAPKSKREEFFDREEELSKLHQLVQLYPLVVVTGLRRVGKSSLVKVFLSESNYPSILVDGRRVYEMSGGNISSVHLLRVLSDEFAKLSKSQKIVNVLKRIRGISVGGNSVEIDAKEFDLSDVFEKFYEFAEREEKFFFVFVDEAQYLRFYGTRFALGNLGEDVPDRENSARLQDHRRCVRKNVERRHGLRIVL